MFLPPHMLRRATGYKLANQGVDTRSLQHYLGHKNIQHTTRYTELAADPLEGFLARQKQVRIVANRFGGIPLTICGRAIDNAVLIAIENCVRLSERIGQFMN